MVKRVLMVLRRTSLARRATPVATTPDPAVRATIPAQT